MFAWFGFDTTLLYFSLLYLILLYFTSLYFTFPGIIPRMHAFTRLHLLFPHACPKTAIFLLIMWARSWRHVCSSSSMLLITQPIYLVFWRNELLHRLRCYCGAIITRKTRGVARDHLVTISDWPCLQCCFILVPMS